MDRKKKKKLYEKSHVIPIVSHVTIIIVQNGREGESCRRER